MKLFHIYVLIFSLQYLSWQLIHNVGTNQAMIANHFKMNENFFHTVNILDN